MGHYVWCILHTLLFFLHPLSLVNAFTERISWKQVNMKVWGMTINSSVENWEGRWQRWGGEIRVSFFSWFLSLDNYIIIWDRQNIEKKMKCALLWISAKGRVAIAIYQCLPPPKAPISLQSRCQVREGRGGSKSCHCWQVDGHDFQSSLHSNLCYSF